MQNSSTLQTLQRVLEIFFAEAKVNGKMQFLDMLIAMGTGKKTVINIKVFGSSRDKDFSSYTNILPGPVDYHHLMHPTPFNNQF